jgi:hypothetical protein
MTSEYLKITKRDRDQIAGYLDKSALPHIDVVQIVTLLMSLVPVNPEKEPEPKGKKVDK